MRAIPVIALVGLLLLPGCTFFDESGSESETEEVLEPEVELRQGCTDPEANNYDQSAEEDDGSCEYDEPEPVLGCTDSDAENYDSNATEDDGTCQFLETIPCNGLVILCHRTYDDVTFPETHNSFSTHEDNI